jgi:hypothetical protein
MRFQELGNTVHMLAQQGDTNFRAFQRLSDSCFKILVDTEPGRNHLVIVQGGATQMQDFVMCSSLGVKLPKGRELTAEMGMDLLRRNAGQAIGSWCLMEDDDGDTWVALRDTFLMSQVDPEWACARIQMLATLADAFEAELGRDDY